MCGACPRIGEGAIARGRAAGLKNGCAPSPKEGACMGVQFFRMAKATAEESRGTGARFPARLLEAMRNGGRKFCMKAAVPLECFKADRYEPKGFSALFAYHVERHVEKRRKQRESMHFDGIYACLPRGEMLDKAWGLCFGAIFCVGTWAVWLKGGETAIMKILMNAVLIPAAAIVSFVAAFPAGIPLLILDELYKYAKAALVAGVKSIRKSP